jgi:hypothetical protein
MGRQTIKQEENLSFHFFFFFIIFYIFVQNTSSEPFSSDDIEEKCFAF